MKDEIENDYPGGYIVEFVSTGPKSYGYRVRLPDGSTKTHLKLKGIRQNVSTLEELNYDTLKKLVVEKPEDPVVIVHDKDIRIEKRHKLITRDVVKRFQVTANKRTPVDDGSYFTVPYGYVHGSQSSTGRDHKFYTH